MIRLRDGYGLDVLGNCYAVGKIRTVRDKKDGSESDIVVAEGYFTDIVAALKWFVKRLRLEAVKDADGGFDELIKSIRSADEKMNGLLQSVLQEVELE